MRKNIVLGLAVLLLAAGCASTRNDPYAGEGTKKDACERSGGYWQATAGVCDRPKS